MFLDNNISRLYHPPVKLASRHRVVPSLILLPGLFVFLASFIGNAALPLSAANEKGRSFLASLFDPALGLLPEYRGANVYWLYHDNYLAAKVLAASHPKIADKIRAAIRNEDPHATDKIRLLFGEAEKPLPFGQYQLTDVRRIGDKLIRTETTATRPLEGWEEYADLLLLACIAENNQSAARRNWDSAMRMWDGHGFLDAAARSDGRYSTYKLGLALLAASHLSPPAKPPAGLLNQLLAMQDESGGWITDYDARGKKIGLANVETTCLAILGLEALAAHPGQIMDHDGTYEAVTKALNHEDWAAVRKLARPGMRANDYIVLWQNSALSGHPIRVGKLASVVNDRLNGTPCKKYSFELENKDGTTSPHMLEVLVREEAGHSEILDFWNFGW